MDMPGPKSGLPIRDGSKITWNTVGWAEYLLDVARRRSTRFACSWTILPLDRSPEPVIQQHIDQKTKPLGALGRLEELACQLALIQRQERITIEQPTVLVFCRRPWDCPTRHQHSAERCHPADGA